MSTRRASATRRQQHSASTRPDPERVAADVTIGIAEKRDTYVVGKDHEAALEALRAELTSKHSAAVVGMMNAQIAMREKAVADAVAAERAAFRQTRINHTETIERMERKQRREDDRALDESTGVEAIVAQLGAMMLRLRDTEANLDATEAELGAARSEIEDLKAERAAAAKGGAL